MRRTALIALLLAAPIAADAAKRPGLAVMDIRAVQGVQPGTATLITDILVTEVSGTRRYDVVSSADISSLLGLEKQKQLLQCGEDSSCLAELGGALGVDYLLSGSVGLLGTRLRISLSVQNVKRARVVARQARFCDANEDALVRATEETVRALLAEVEGSLAAARAPEPAVAPVEPSPPPKVVPPPPVAKAPPAKVDLTPAPPPPGKATVAATTPVEPRPPEPKGPGLGRRGWGYIVGGAGIVLLAAGGGFDAMAYSAYQDQKDAVAAHDKAAYDSALDSGKSKATLANVFYGTGVAALGAGAFLYFTAPSGAQVSVTPTDGGAVLSFGGVLP
jgi:TolB-like protein